MMMSQDAKARSQLSREIRRSYLHLSTSGVTYSARGFCSLNTRGCISVSAELAAMILLPVDMAGFYLKEAHKRLVEKRMAEQKAQPRVTLEEALAQYDKICWRQKLGIG
jgi:hypothetical protein